MNRIILILSLVFFSLKAFCQKKGQALTDSLLSEIPKAKNDTVKAKILNEVGFYYEDVNPDSTMKYVGMGLKLTTKMKW